MAANLNKVMLIGRLGADPELRETQGGQTVANLRVATTETWTDREGARQERTEWHRVTVWGKPAEACGKYLAKGRLVYIEGSLQTREYTDKEGVARKSTDIVAREVLFMDRGEDRASSPPAPSGPSGPAKPNPSRLGWDAPQGKGGWAAPRDDDDPIPF
jgi:single-strand DNA-binding protein